MSALAPADKDTRAAGKTTAVNPFRRSQMNGRTVLVSMGFALTALMGSVAFAQAPAGSTGECKDGTYTSNATKRGACAGHKGVKTWYESQAASPSEKTPKAAKETKAEKAAKTTESTAPAKSPATAAGAGAMGAAGAAATTNTASSPSAAKKASKDSAMSTTAAAGGGPGKVWVNTSSNVYHCMNDEWYGKTKQGQYMSEADAKAKGARAARGKACS